MKSFDKIQKLSNFKKKVIVILIVIIIAIPLVMIIRNNFQKKLGELSERTYTWEVEESEASNMIEKNMEENLKEWERVIRDLEKIAASSSSSTTSSVSNSTTSTTTITTTTTTSTKELNKNGE